MLTLALASLLPFEDRTVRAFASRLMGVPILCHAMSAAPLMIGDGRKRTGVVPCAGAYPLSSLWACVPAGRTGGAMSDPSGGTGEAAAFVPADAFFAHDDAHSGDLCDGTVTVRAANDAATDSVVLHRSPSDAPAPHATDELNTHRRHATSTLPGVLIQHGTQVQVVVSNRAAEEREEAAVIDDLKEPRPVHQQLALAAEVVKRTAVGQLNTEAPMQRSHAAGVRPSENIIIRTDRNRIEVVCATHDRHIDGKRCASFFAAVRVSCAMHVRVMMTKQIHSQHDVDTISGAQVPLRRPPARRYGWRAAVHALQPGLSVCTHQCGNG